MDKELERAVATVMQERIGKFDKSFAAVAKLVPVYPLDELADRLVIGIPTSVPWEVVADMLGILIWSTNDNGLSIVRSAERWLTEAKDIRRIEIALSLDVYPFETLDEMKEVLAVVRRRFPHVTNQCKALVNLRAQLRESPNGLG